MTQTNDTPAGSGGPAAADPIVSHEEAAAILRIAPSAVRSTLRRNGIPEIRGYRARDVEALQKRREARSAEGPTAQGRPE